MKVSNMVIDQNEELVYSLKNGNLQNVISGEGIKEETAVITNKRLYYSNKAGIIDVASREEVVDLEDITGTKVAEHNPIGIIILGAVFAIFGLMLGGKSASNSFAGFIACVLILLVFLIIYFALHKKYLIIEYAGGKIQFSLIGYSKENIIGFRNAIYSEKEKIKQTYYK